MTDMDTIDPKLREHIDRLVRDHGSTENVLDGVLLAAEAVIYDAQGVVNAKSVGDAAEAIVRLSNSISDLKSWCVGYDVETGTLPYEREDEDQA